MSIDLDVLALSFVVLLVCTHSVSTVHPLDVCLRVHVVPRGEAGPTQCRNLRMALTPPSSSPPSLRPTGW